MISNLRNIMFDLRVISDTYSNRNLDSISATFREAIIEINEFAENWNISKSLIVM